jgi:hypothetical protein
MLLTMHTVRQLDMWIVSILLTCTNQVVAVVLSELGYQYITRFVLRDVFRLSLTVGVCDLASAASPGGRGYFEGESCNRRHPQSTGVTVKIIHEPSHHANVQSIIFIVDLVLSLEDLNISAFCVVVRRTGFKADVFSRRKTRPGIRFGGSVNGRRHMSCCVVRGSGQSVSSTCLERARCMWSKARRWWWMCLEARVHTTGFRNKKYLAFLGLGYTASAADLARSTLV